MAHLRLSGSSDDRVGVVRLRIASAGVGTAVLLAFAACSDSGPVGGGCTVTSIEIEGLPDRLVAFEEVALSADVGSSGCADLEVAWSGSEALQVASDGTVSSEVLGGPFQITATVEGVESSVEVIVVSPDAVTDERWALAWLNRPDVPTYTVGNGYWTSTGGDILVERDGPGLYTVRFAGLAAGPGQRQAVAVSAYGAGFVGRCAVAGYGNSGSDLEVDVRCYDSTGAPVDSRFDILVAPAGFSNGRHAFAVTPDEVGGLLPAARAHSSEGTAIHIERVGTGHYDVTFAGLSREAVSSSIAESFHVTSWGQSTNWCKIGGWETVDTVNVRLTVYCYTVAGQRADARFSVLMLEQPRTGGFRLGTMWADPVGQAGGFTPDPAFSYNSSGATNSAQRLSPGQNYSGWTGLERTGAGAETNLATAVGEDATYCKVRSWGDAATWIDCYAPDGTPQDSEYTAIWIE